MPARKYPAECMRGNRMIAGTLEIKPETEVLNQFLWRFSYDIGGVHPEKGVSVRCAFNSADDALTDAVRLGIEVQNG